MQNERGDPGFILKIEHTTKDEYRTISIPH
jgi:hypothetical protein